MNKRELMLEYPDIYIAMKNFTHLMSIEDKNFIQQVKDNKKIVSFHGKGIFVARQDYDNGPEARKQRFAYKCIPDFYDLDEKIHDMMSMEFLDEIIFSERYDGLNAGFPTAFITSNVKLYDKMRSLSAGVTQNQYCYELDYIGLRMNGGDGKIRVYTPDQVPGLT